MPNKKCSKCTKQASYNFEGEKSPIFCVNHKEEGMIDVVSKKCLKCSKQPNYNFEGEKKPIFCGKHKDEGMVNVISKKCLKCDKNPIYNFKGEKKPIFCGNHKEEDMVNVVSKRCISGHCDTIANRYYNNYCAYCFTNLFPTHPKTKTARLRNKEIAVKNWLYENGHPDFVNDKPIYLGNCDSVRRVDLYKYIGERHILCIEVDERQHKYYDKADEERRYHELYRLGYTMVFIRYNPDRYKDRYNKVKQPFFTTRMDVLLKTIDKWTEKITNEECEEDLLYVEYLYYDGY